MSNNNCKKKYTFRRFLWDLTLSVCTAGLWTIWLIFKALRSVSDN